MTGAPGDDPRAQLGRLLEEDPADLYENAPMGYLSALPDGRIVKVNRTFCAWTGRSPEDLLGARFQDLLTIGGRVFHETHVVPLLRMQGAVREIALDVVRTDGSVLPCLVNAVELRDDDGTPVLMRATLFEATARRRYERELLNAQRAAEESETPLPDGAAGRVRHGRGHVGGRRRDGDRRPRAGGAGRPRRRPRARRGGRPGGTASPVLHTEHAVGAAGRPAARAARGGDRPARTRAGAGCADGGPRRPAAAGPPGGGRRHGGRGAVEPRARPGHRRQPAAGGARARARRARRRSDQPGRAGDRGGDRPRRRRAALDPRPSGGPGAGAGPAARADRAAGGARGVPARGRPAARGGRGRVRDGRAARRPGRGAAGRPLRHRPHDRARAGPGGGPASRPRPPAPGRRPARAAPAGPGRAAPERAGAARRRHPVGALDRRRVPGADGVRRAPPGGRAGARADQHRRGPARRRGTAAGRRHAGHRQLAVAVHRRRRGGGRAAGPAGVARGRQGAAVRARRPHLAHAAGEPAAAAPAGGARAADGGAVPGGDARGGGRRRLLRRRPATGGPGRARGRGRRRPRHHRRGDDGPAAPASTARCWWTGRGRAR